MITIRPLLPSAGWTSLALLTAAALSILPLPGALLLAAGAAAVVAGMVVPSSGLALVAVGVPFGGDLGLLAGGLRLGLTELAATLTAGVFFLRAAARRRFRLRGLGVWAPLAVLIVVALFSTAQGPGLTESLKEMAKWLLFGGVATLAATLVIDRRTLLLVSGAILAAAGAEALYGLGQAAAGAGPLGFILGGSLRAFGTFGQPNPFAAYLSTGAIVAGSLTLAVISRTPQRPVSLLALVLLSLLVLLLAGVSASLSRSAWVGLLAAAAAVVAVHFRRGVLLVGLAFLAGALVWSQAGAGWLPPVVASRLEALAESLSWFDPRAVPLTSENFALVHRMAIWQAAWDMFQANPWLGAGPGNFDLAYPAFALPGWPVLPGHAHNFYLNLLAETGVLGLAAYLGLLIFLIGKSLKGHWQRRASPDPGWYGTALAGVGLAAFLTVYQLFDNLYVHSMTAQAGLIFGLAFASAEPDDERDGS